MMPARRAPRETFSLFCYRCGHSWFSRDGDLPRRCPRCHSSRWERPVRKRMECRRCGHRWEIVSIGESCPECGTSVMKGLTERSLHCNQCDYDWIQRGRDAPSTCPLCRSREWDLPKAERVMCGQCHHIWRKRRKEPRKCPKCQSVRWKEPRTVMRCQRCGHRWNLNSGRTEKDVKSCPSCRSVRWDRPPNVYECDRCGRSYILRENGRVGKCPRCDPYHAVMHTVCHLCGEEWDSVPYGKGQLCPSCGAKAEKRNRTFVHSMMVWTDGDRSLRYRSDDGYGYIYLMHGNVPVATVYLMSVCRDLGISADQFIAAVNRGTMEEQWEELADAMFRDRNEYKKNIRYFMNRLGLDETDAEYLAIHFTGMGPSAIAIKFGVPFEEVRRSFDRIMAAYSDSNIIVDDTIYTEDPFNYY